MVSFTRYTALLSAQDVRQIFAASFLGRLPVGITGLAILILVQSTTGSFASGGAATGCYVAGLAFMAPVLGRIIDRRGPRGVLTGCGLLLFPAALVALILLVRGDAPRAELLAAAFCAGACFPPITVCMRTFLKQRFADEQNLATAYSVESVLIELVFILGPMLVAILVAYTSAVSPVAAAAACGFVGTALFLRAPALRTWRIEQRTQRSFVGPLGERGFPWLIAIVLTFSMAFGLLEIGVTAYATRLGQPGLAGVFLGLMSVGSAMGGLAYGSRSWRGALTLQFAATLAVMALGLGVLALGWQPLAFALWSVLAGVVMAPALIIQSMLVAKAVRPQYSTEAFTWSSSALLAGVGAGLAGGGALVEWLPYRAAFAAAALCALSGAAGAALLARAARR